jgi:pSer/pThr/pTyr-binding forkhead associated (FHA) protein
LFTYGTQWGAVNRIAFGALLCGPFAVVLSLGRRSLLRTILAGVIGTVLGGAVNYATDSAADIIGLSCSGRGAAFGSLIAMLAWCLLVPFGIALTILLAQGVTKQRIIRAVFSLKFTSAASLVVQFVGGMLAAQDGTGAVNLISQIPVWRLVESAVGLVFGLTILAADEWIRAASLQLIHGRNEYVDWSLDNSVSRIGSAEGSEIYIQGYRGVKPLHAAILRHGDQFVLEAKGISLVNGVPVSRVPLQAQDVIAIGEAKLVFRLGRQVAARHATVASTAAAFPQAKILEDSYGQQIPLVPGRYGVGRDSNNAICLYNDPGVGASHAEFIATPTDLIVSDLPGTTGTRVRGQRIFGPTTLKIGDVIEFGDTRFTYRR